nr:hypothetical protein [Betaproteobacteria bacterium AqS2]
ADLRFFIGGNALLCAALAVSFAGVGIFIHVGTGPGTLVRAVGLVMFIIAAFLLQAVAKPKRDDEDEAAEEKA